MRKTSPKLAVVSLAVLAALLATGCQKHDAQKPQPQITDSTSAVSTPADSSTDSMQADSSDGAAAGTLALSDAPVGIDWLPGDQLETAFNRAAQEKRPVFLFWGAVWCPYCKDLKASVFARPDFKEKLRLFVPVYLDGDTNGAQKWGDRFRVAGYPTVLVLGADQKELARISGGMDLSQYANVLDLVLGDVKPVDDLLAIAAKSNRPLSVDDCHRLAYNAWSLDATLEADSRRLAKGLNAASERCPAAATSEKARLTVIAAGLAADVEAKAIESGKPPSASLNQLIARVNDVLNEREWSVANADVLQYLDDSFFKAVALAQPSEVEAWLTRWTATMDAAASDAHYTNGDRLAAVNGKLIAVKALTPGGKIAPALVADANRRVEDALRSTKEPMARAGVVNAALNVLDTLDNSQRGYEIASEEAQTSKTPYYYLGDMADFQEKLGRKDEAVALLQRAYNESKGAATRFQWGSNYVLGLIRIHPNDESAIQSAALEVLGELDGPDRLYSRSRTRFDRVSTSLKQWGSGGKHSQAMTAIRARMSEICGKISSSEPAKQSCKGFLA